MTPGYPCPNPTCSHVFPPSAVAGALALTCPRCGTVFQLRAGPATAAPPRPAAVPPPAWPPTAPPRPVPGAPPTRPAVPVAPPVAHAVPVAPVVPQAPPAHPAAHLFNVTSGPATDGKRGRRARGHGALHTALLLISLLAVGGLGAFALVRMVHWQQQARTAPQGQVHESDEFYYTFLMPSEPWKRDDKTKLALSANCLAYRRHDPTVWMALAAKDFKTRTPRQAEVIEEAVNRLLTFFQPETLEYDLDSQEARLGGQPCVRLIFTGDDFNNVKVSGECFVLPYAGVGYMLFVWTPAQEVVAARDDFEETRRRFGLRQDRVWNERQPRPVEHSGINNDCSLTDLSELWIRAEPKDYDPAAELALIAKDPAKPEDVTRYAEVVVLALQPEAGVAPERLARMYVEEQEKNTYPMTAIDVEKDTSGMERSAPGPVGTAPGHVSYLLMRNSPDRHRFVILGVAESGGVIYVVKAECAWDRRSLWENDFTRLMGTFKIKK